MTKNSARKKPVRAQQAATGRAYMDARTMLSTGLVFDLSWLHPEVTACPVCGQSEVDWMLRGRFAPEPGEVTNFVRPVDMGVCMPTEAGGGGCCGSGDAATPGTWSLPNWATADACPVHGEAPVAVEPFEQLDGSLHAKIIAGDGTMGRPVDGRWFRYRCPQGFWWISAPRFAPIGPDDPYWAQFR